MEWFSQNWVWVLFFGGMIAMHLFGHGGHGGHGGENGNVVPGPGPAGKDNAPKTPEQRSGHQH